MSEDSRARVSREAGEIQRLAADPSRSVALRASAGSGKTKVLVDRILRLLLVKTRLKSVVALTFTRKAAVEIRERLRERLGELARLEHDGLVEELHRLLGRPPEDEELDRAALVYEEVLEDSTGLLIGTIHTFCTTLLRRFADEAGLDPAFKVIENTDELWDEALTRLEAEVSREPGGPADLAAVASDPAAARKALRGVEHERLELDRWCDRVAAEQGHPETPRYRAGLLNDLEADLAVHLFADSPLSDLTSPSLEDLRRPALVVARAYAESSLTAILETQPESDRDKLAGELDKRRDVMLAVIDALDGGEAVEPALDALFTAVLTKEGAPRQTRSGARKEEIKSVRVAVVADTAAPVQALRRLRLTIDLFRNNVRLLRYRLRALDHYTRLKERDRCLDYHDLERLAWRLVRDPELGEWILYRLDARLDHLLVDEFQDTNRNQWEMLRPFAEEFVAGAAEDGRPRSAFFVGDVKQSIYGFRGARPVIFGEVEDWLVRMTEKPTLTLPANFRSLPAVVETVGALFQAPPLSDLLPGPREVEAARQTAYRSDGRGEVLITEPVSADDDAPQAEAAARAVRTVRRIVAEATVVENDARRAARYGDVLLLSRTRTHLAAYEDAFRDAGIPIVPAGRGALARSREVRDILQLLRWLVFPSDDAALACVLRSPLFRCDEPAFQALLTARLSGGGKRGGLWPALLDVDPASRLRTARDRLDSWQKKVGNESVHRLLRRIFREADAPDRFAAALGDQARYNLLRLHDLALSYGQTSFPTLRGFVSEIERAEVREDEEEAVLPDTDMGRVRMMTIHGAKGLEAPFVLLADYADPMVREAERIVLPIPRNRANPVDESGPLVTGLRKEHRSGEGPVADAARQALGEIRSEQANLLYVAMTRARDGLTLVGAASNRNREAPSFARWLEASPRGLDTPPDWMLADSEPGDAIETRTTDTSVANLWEPCGWAPRIELAAPSASETAPSDAPLAARQDAPADRDDALAHGTEVHRWLERATETGAMPAGDGDALREARAVFENPHHDWIFRPTDGRAYCEAPVIARNGRTTSGTERRILGTVDRLLLTDTRIVVIDYKTNRVAEDQLDAVVAHYRPQMEMYRDALTAARPGRPVTLVLLFTALEGESGPGRAVTLV
jgi:ATP-dependent helicase/nuclease subunit A